VRHATDNRARIAR